MTQAPKNEKDDLFALFEQIKTLAETGMSILTPPLHVPDATFGVLPTGNLRQFQFTATTIGYTEYFWDWGNGQTEGHAHAQSNHTYQNDGSYVVTLRVTDPSGFIATTSQTVVVGTSIPVPVPPLGTFVATQDVAPGQFDFLADDPTGLFSWDWGDGSSVESHSIPSATHTYVLDGLYTVHLSVTMSGLTTSSSQMVIVEGTSGAFAAPTLPATFPTARPAFGGTTHVCNTAADLTAALAACAAGTIVGGDIIALAPGVNFDGQFTLPARPSWAGTTDIVEIRTNISTAALNAVCPEGTRMTPTMATTLNLATLRATVGNGLIVSAFAASGYRLTALRATVTPGLSNSNSLIRFGDTTLTLDSQACYDLILDRCYCFGEFAKNVRRAVAMCGPRQAIVDSWLAPFYDDGSDAQAWAIFGYKGPYMILNSYCEGWSEGFLVGGGNSGISPSNINGVISDVTIRKCHFTRDSAGIGVHLNPKNGVEFKTGRRMLMEYCIIEHTVPGGQTGVLLSIKSTEQWSIGNPHRTLEGVSDLEVRFNWFRKGARGLSIAANPDAILGEQSIPVHRTRVHNNLWSDINTVSPWVDVGGTGGISVMMLNDLSDVTIEHNTVVNVDASNEPAAILDATIPSIGMIRMRSNILPHGLYGWVNGDGGYASGTATINAAWPTHDWSKNILVGSPIGASNFPNPNVDTIPKLTDSVVGYTNLATLNVKLASGPGIAGGHDGLDIGIADVDAFFTNLVGVP